MDKLIKGMLFDGTVNVTAISGKAMLTAARDTHKLSRVCTAALGRVIMQTAMMSAALKNETDRLTCILKGGGEAGSIVCTAYPGGIVKGYVDNPTTEIAMYGDKLDVAMAVGWFGEMTVIRDLSMKEPYIGKTKITSGEVAQDFANYYMQSEQQPTLIYLGERIDVETGEVLSAGGLMIAPMPNCPSDVIDKLERFAVKTAEIPDMLKERDLDAVLSELFEGMGFEETACMTPVFRCDCSKERLMQALASLGVNELRDMAEKDHGAHMQCHFCNKEYDFTEAELRSIISVLEEKK